MASCRMCRRPLDGRGFCETCEAAQVRCPRCERLIKDGPSVWVNWQVCHLCLTAIALCVDCVRFGQLCVVHRWAASERRV